MLSKNAIGNLINRYKAVLKKCHFLNTFAALMAKTAKGAAATVMTGLLVMSSVDAAVAAPLSGSDQSETTAWTVPENLIVSGNATVTATNIGALTVEFGGVSSTNKDSLTITGGTTYTFDVNNEGNGFRFINEDPDDLAYNFLNIHGATLKIMNSTNNSPAGLTLSGLTVNLSGNGAIPASINAHTLTLTDGTNVVVTDQTETLGHLVIGGDANNNDEDDNATFHVSGRGSVHTVQETFTLNGADTAANTLTIDNGGQFTVNGTTMLNKGTVLNNGTFTANAGMDIKPSAANAVVISGAGTLSVKGKLDIDLQPVEIRQESLIVGDGAFVNKIGIISVNNLTLRGTGDGDNNAAPETTFGNLTVRDNLIIQGGDGENTTAGKSTGTLERPLETYADSSSQVHLGNNGTVSVIGGSGGQAANNAQGGAGGEAALELDGLSGGASTLQDITVQGGQGGEANSSKGGTGGNATLLVTMDGITAESIIVANGQVGTATSNALESSGGTASLYVGETVNGEDDGNNIHLTTATLTVGGGGDNASEGGYVSIAPGDTLTVVGTNGATGTFQDGPNAQFYIDGILDAQNATLTGGSLQGKYIADAADAEIRLNNVYITTDNLLPEWTDTNEDGDTDFDDLKEGQVVIDNGGTLRANTLNINPSGTSTDAPLNVDGTIVTNVLIVGGSDYEAHSESALPTGQETLVTQSATGTLTMEGEGTVVQVLGESVVLDGERIAGDIVDVQASAINVNSGSTFLLGDETNELGGFGGTIGANMNVNGGSLLRVERGEWYAPDTNTGTGSVNVDFSGGGVLSVYSGATLYTNTDVTLGEEYFHKTEEAARASGGVVSSGGGRLIFNNLTLTQANRNDNNIDIANARGNIGVVDTLTLRGDGTLRRLIASHAGFSAARLVVKGMSDTTLTIDNPFTLTGVEGDTAVSGVGGIVAAHLTLGAPFSTSFSTPDSDSWQSAGTPAHVGAELRVPDGGILTVAEGAYWTIDNSVTIEDASVRVNGSFDVSQNSLSISGSSTLALGNEGMLRAQTGNFITGMVLSATASSGGSSTASGSSSNTASTTVSGSTDTSVDTSTDLTPPQPVSAPIVTSAKIYTSGAGVQTTVDMGSSSVLRLVGLIPSTAGVAVDSTNMHLTSMNIINVAARNALLTGGNSSPGAIVFENYIVTQWDSDASLADITPGLQVYNPDATLAAGNLRGPGTNVNVLSLTGTGTSTVQRGATLTLGANAASGAQLAQGPVKVESGGTLTLLNQGVVADPVTNASGATTIITGGHTGSNTSGWQRSIRLTFGMLSPDTQIESDFNELGLPTIEIASYTSAGQTGLTNVYFNTPGPIILQSGSTTTATGLVSIESLNFTNDGRFTTAATTDSTAAAADQTVVIMDVPVSGSGSWAIGAKDVQAWLLLMNSVTATGGFLGDPAWTASGNTVDKASQIIFYDMTPGATYNPKYTLAVGRNSFATYAIDGDTAMNWQTRFGSVVPAHAWGPNGTTAALFVGAPVNLNNATNSGVIIVDGTLTRLEKANAGGFSLFADTDNAPLSLVPKYATSGATGVAGRTTVLAPGSVFFAANSALFLDAPKFTATTEGTGDYALIGNKVGALVVDDSSVLVLDGALKDMVVNVAKDFTGTTVWDEDQIFATNGFLDVELMGTNGSNYQLKIISAPPPYDEENSRIYPKTAWSLETMLFNLYNLVLVSGYDPAVLDNGGIRFLDSVMRTYGDNGDGGAKLGELIEGAAQIAAGAGAFGTTRDVSLITTDALLARFGGGGSAGDGQSVEVVTLPFDDAATASIGLAAGNGSATDTMGMSVWLSPLYKHTSAYGFGTGTFDSGYNTDLAGIMLGADVTFAEAFTLGVAFNVGGGNTSTTGDIADSTNNFDFWGLTGYLGYHQNNFGLLFDVGYSGVWNDTEQDMDSAVSAASTYGGAYAALGGLESDFTSSAWTVGLRAEYTFETEVMDIIPHIGIRYTSVTVDGHDVDSKGAGTVFSVDSSQQNTWSFPIGVTLSSEIETESGWSVTPRVDFGIVAVAGDFDAKTSASVPNYGQLGALDLKMQTVDGFAFDGGLGLGISNGAFSFDVNYNVQLSEHTTSHMVMGSFRYEF